MRLYRGIVLIVLSSCGYQSIQAADPRSFIIASSAEETQKTRDSRDQIKSDIGSDVQKTFESLAVLQREIGGLMTRVAALQQRLVQDAAALIDNKPPFKKASRADLAAHRARIRSQQQEIQKLAHTIAQSPAGTSIPAVAATPTKKITE